MYGQVFVYNEVYNIPYKLPHAEYLNGLSLAIHWSGVMLIAINALLKGTHTHTQVKKLDYSYMGQPSKCINGKLKPYII